METLEEQVANLRSSELYQKAQFDFTDFDEILVNYLGSDLETEQRIQLFEHFDPEKTRYISKEHIDTLINMVTNSEEAFSDNQTSDIISQLTTPKDTGPGTDSTPKTGRGSFFYDMQKKRLTFSPSNTIIWSSQRTSHERPSVEKTTIQLKKISAELLNGLTPDKISELKYIFRICDPKNTGEFPFSDLLRVLEDIKTVATKEEILGLFDLVKEEQTNKVTKQLFGKLLSELERKQLYEASPQADLFSQRVSKDRSSLNRTVSEGIKMNPESEGEVEEEEEEQFTTYFNKSEPQDQGLLFQLMQKIEQAIEMKPKDQNLKNLLFEIHELYQTVQEKVKAKEINLESAARKLQEFKIRDDMQNSRINSLEVELKKIYDSHDILEQSNENYWQQIIQLERKVAALRTDLGQINEQNRLYVNLESTCKSLENTVYKLKLQLNNSESEKTELKKNYEQLSGLLNQTEIYAYQNNESQAGSSSKVEMALKTNVEKLKLDIELQNKELESKNTYIKSLETNIDDLKNALNLSQELINELRVKEEDYKKKYARLEEEYDNLRRDNHEIRGSMRKASQVESLAKELAGSNVISAKGSIFGSGARINLEEILGTNIHSNTRACVFIDI